jgi:hypothetical protein
MDFRAKNLSPGIIKREIVHSGQFLEDPKIMSNNIALPSVPAGADRLSRLRDMLIECNFLFNLATDQDQLLDGICHLVVQAGGYSRAWVRLSANPAGRAPAESAPPCGAIQNQKEYYFAACSPARSDTFVGNPTQPGITLPLQDQASTFGKLTIYSPDQEPFDDQETALLAQLAAGLADCLLALRAAPPLGLIQSPPALSQGWQFQPKPGQPKPGQPDRTARHSLINLLNGTI